MERVTQRFIREGIARGTFKDLDRLFGTEEAPDRGELDRYAYSSGKLGLSGSLFVSRKDGQLYGVYGRNAALFYYC